MPVQLATPLRLVGCVCLALLLWAGVPAHGDGAVFGLDCLPGRPLNFGYLNAIRSGQPASREIPQLNYHAIDAVILGFVEPRTNASLNLNLGAFATYAPLLVTHSHRHRKACLMSLGGGFSADPNPFSVIAARADLRARFASNILHSMIQMGFDGVDIDYEFPRTDTQREEFTLLMRDLHARIKASNSNYIVMFGASPGFYINRYDWFRLREYSDFAFYFGYDWKNPANGPMTQPGSLQFLSGGSEVIEASCRGALRHIISSGYPPSKILMGIPFYSSANRSWLGIRDTWLSRRQQFLTAMHPDFRESLHEGEWWNTPDTIPHKLAAVLDRSRSVLGGRNTLRGVGIWEFGHESAKDPDLSQAIGNWMDARYCDPASPVPPVRIHLVANQSFRLHFPDTNGCSYVVEASRDLEQWEPVFESRSHRAVFEYQAPLTNRAAFHRVRRN
ncbi:MAG: glycoside hydrolase family 18 protein [Verrucomicrobia bacterium]|nr:glycoside hydrolase family 18 protein [Verrucomicrobiota bacterium]